MKTVFDNHGVALNWARERSHAFSHNGNFWHSGNVINSYRTPIARLVNLNGFKFALVTNESYSVTTEGKHKGAIRAALHGLGIEYVCVPILWPSGRKAHAENRAHLVARYRDYVAQSLRSTKYFSFDRLCALKRDALLYCDWHKVARPDLPISADLERIKARFDRLENERSKRASRNVVSLADYREREAAS